jgi:hypothetical protein
MDSRSNKIDGARSTTSKDETKISKDGETAALDVTPLLPFLLLE